MMDFIGRCWPPVLRCMGRYCELYKLQYKSQELRYKSQIVSIISLENAGRMDNRPWKMMLFYWKMARLLLQFEGVAHRTDRGADDPRVANCNTNTFSNTFFSTFENWKNSERMENRPWNAIISIENAGRMDNRPWKMMIFCWKMADYCCNSRYYQAVAAGATFEWFRLVLDCFRLFYTGFRLVLDCFLADVGLVWRSLERSSGCRGVSKTDEFSI